MVNSEDELTDSKIKKTLCVLKRKRKPEELTPREKRMWKKILKEGNIYS